MTVCLDHLYLGNAQPPRCCYCGLPFSACRGHGNLRAEEGEIGTQAQEVFVIQAQEAAAEAQAARDRTQKKRPARKARPASGAQGGPARSRPMPSLSSESL